jgi:O-antigen ligase
MTQPDHPPVSFLPLALLAVAFPFLIAGSAPPTSTYFNQVVAFGGCGVWLLVWALTARPSLAAQPASGATKLLLVAGVLLVAATLTSSAPWGQRLAPLACLVLAGALMHATAAATRAGRIHDWAAPLMTALLVAGLLSLVVGLVQVFQPELADGRLVSFPTIAGRAIGNMRQPNQLSTLLLWSAAAAVWLGVRERQPLAVMAAVLGALVFGVALTASRTGSVGVLLLALWGAVDRRLPKQVRWLLLAMLPLYALSWWGLEQWLSAHGVMYYGEDQLKKTLHGDPSSSRGKIWANTWDLIQAHPWTGVGVGAYNFIWSMTPFPGRPVAFYDHSHNVVLQLAVESGVPMALVILGCTLAALWMARPALTVADDDTARGARTALFMLVMAGVHSLLEYPLWYVYFLLPAAMLAGWLTGLAPARPRPVDTLADPTPPRFAGAWRPVWCITGAVALAGSLWSTVEYGSVAVIFEPELSWGEPAPLAERIAQGQRSVLWGHHADYASVTMAPKPEEVFSQFERPLYHLADTRLLIAYARALLARGEIAKASHVAARLREFHNPASADFFALCDAPGAAPGATPFQCLPDPALPAEALRPKP